MNEELTIPFNSQTLKCMTSHTQAIDDIQELITELFTEMLKCTPYELRELKSEWVHKLTGRHAEPELISYYEKLVDLVIDQKAKRKIVGIDDIKIFPWFEETPPNPEKMERKERVFEETGLLNQSEIVLNSGNYLIDGYSTYLLAKKYGVDKVPVIFGKRQVVMAYHRQNGKLYSWELPVHLVDHVSPGDRLLVHTGNGVRSVTVLAINDYGKCAHVEPLRMAIRIIRRGTEQPAAQ